MQITNYLKGYECFYMLAPMVISTLYGLGPLYNVLCLFQIVPCMSE